MKLKNIFAALFATLAVAAGCAKEEAETLSEVQVSKSFVCIPQNGGQATVTLTANANWTLDVLWGSEVAEEGKWLTVNKLSGSAAKGESLVFAAGASASYRAVEVNIQCAGQTQVLKVTQGEDIPASVSVKELLAERIVGKVYQLVVKVDKITNPKYGGMDVSDATGSVSIYGVNKDVHKDFSKLGVVAGDEIKIKGTWSSYGNLENVEILSIKKALLSLDRTEFELNSDGMEEYYKQIFDKNGEPVLDKDGKPTYEKEVSLRPMAIAVTVKGQTIACESPDWIAIKSLKPCGKKNESTLYTFNVLPFKESGASRKGEIVFKSTSGKNESVVAVSVKQKGLPSAIQPRSIADFLNEEVNPDKEYQLSGIIAKIDSDIYGNFHLKDQTGEVLVYGLTKLKVNKNDKSFKSLGLQVGDYVTIIGSVGEHKGVKQVAGPAYLDKAVKVKPATIAEFLKGKVGDKACRYALTGKVTKIEMDKKDKTKISPYGNFTLVDDSGSVYVYGLVNAPGYYFDKEKEVWKFKNNKSFPSLGLKEGDVVTICSFLSEYNGKKQAIESYLLPK